VLLVPLSFFVLWRTAFGLRLRSVGENPVAADSLGVPVYRLKYAAVVASGAFAGLGGAALVVGSIYREGQTAGRGFIGLAAVIFGNWRPGGLAAGAGLFGYADALQLRAATPCAACCCSSRCCSSSSPSCSCCAAGCRWSARARARRRLRPLVRRRRHVPSPARRLHPPHRHAGRAGGRVAAAATTRADGQPYRRGTST
jgi:hypothetical protein